MNGKRTFIPALRFHALTPLFDLVMQRLLGEYDFKASLLDAVAPKSGQHLVDLGCGTGALALLAEKRVPGLTITGLDADPAILQKARAKAKQHGSSIAFREAMGQALPLEPETVDLVVSTLMFHHLTMETKRAVLGEIHRVLRPGGTVGIADWGKPANGRMSAAYHLVQCVDGYETTQSHRENVLARLLPDCGFEPAPPGQAFNKWTGTLRIYVGKKPAG